jgi:hypothetical protein
VFAQLVFVHDICAAPSPGVVPLCPTNLTDDLVPLAAVCGEYRYGGGQCPDVSCTGEGVQETCEQPRLSLVGYRTVDYSPPFWTVQVEVANSGPAVAYAVEAMMQENIPWLLIPDPNCFYGEIPSGSSSWGNDTYTFDLTSHPGGSFNVWFDVTYTDVCDSTHVIRLDPGFDPDAATGIGQSALSYRLGQNYPNPFHPATEIAYAIPVAGEVTLRVYDVSGKLIRTLVDGHKGPGAHSVSWDGKDNAGRVVASGVYFYRMEAGRFVETKRMAFLK